MSLLHLLRQNPVIAAVKDNAFNWISILTASLYPFYTAISAPSVKSSKRLKTPGNMPLFMSICWKARQIKKW